LEEKEGKITTIWLQSLKNAQHPQSKLSQSQPLFAALVFSQAEQYGQHPDADPASEEEGGGAY